MYVFMYMCVCLGMCVCVLRDAIYVNTHVQVLQYAGPIQLHIYVCKISRDAIYVNTHVQYM